MGSGGAGAGVNASAFEADKWIAEGANVVIYLQHPLSDADQLALSAAHLTNIFKERAPTTVVNYLPSPTTIYRKIQVSDPSVGIIGTIEYGDSGVGGVATRGLLKRPYKLLIAKSLLLHLKTMLREDYEKLINKDLIYAMSGTYLPSDLSKMVGGYRRRGSRKNRKSRKSKRRSSKKRSSRKNRS